MGYILLHADVATAAAAAYITQLGSGSKFQIRSGSPAGPGNTANGVLLATVTIVGSWTADTAGVIVAANPASVLPTTGGIAGHFRLTTSANVAKFEGTITDMDGDGDIKVSNVTLTTTVPLNLGIPRIQVPQSV